MPISKKTPVYDIMTKNLVVADLNTKLSKAQELFLDYGVEHLPIVHEGTLVGIVSEFDVMKLYAMQLKEHGAINREELEEKFDMEHVMTSNPVTISPDTTIGQASQTLVENKFEALPVIDNGELVGLVTVKDLVDYLAQLYS
jgi:predicted transcriptional regulator